MKKTKLFLLVSLVTAGVLLSSCIKDEALNVEADITSATIDGAKELLIVEPKVEKNQIVFRLIEEPKVEAASEGDNDEVSYLFAPEFTLSKGATISPASGTARDFTEPQKYVVTAENGVVTKEYTVSFIVDKGILLNYSFENADIIKTEGYAGEYHQFFTLLGNGSKKTDWSSANEGFNFLIRLNSSIVEEVKPSVYPTVQVEDGYKGKGVMLQTNSTGALGAMFGSPLAAGNLFLGDFDVSMVMQSLKTTKFGQPYTYTTAPAAVKGYFKYQAGDEFVVNNEPSSLEEDAWDAYAILFEKSDKDNFLTGDHNFEDSRMVSVAKLDDAKRVETDKWTEFELRFENVAGKSFDADKEYMFTIVFSSSKEGAFFNGAVGSKLWIDEVEIVLAD